MSMTNKIPVVSVVGPTASGKTKIGVMLAKMLDGEVVSADSMQIYRDMDIATAKPTQEETDGIPHHLIGFLPPEDSFSVVRYVELAKKIITDIHARDKLPILVGGTGLYVDSLLNNIQFAENDSDDKLRIELRQKAEREGVGALVEELRQFDPESAERIEPQNIKRLIRAIEIYRTTGITMTEQNRQSRLLETPYCSVKIGLKAKDRQFLYDRINKRVDIMAQNGLIDEAKEILSRKCSPTAEKAIGYKELSDYFNGNVSLQEALDELKKQTRHYAKRQLTWFMRDKEICWFDIDTFSDTYELEKSVLDYTKQELVKLSCFNLKFWRQTND